MRHTNFESETAAQGSSQAKRTRNEKDFSAAKAPDNRPGDANQSHANLSHHVKSLLADQVGSGAATLARFAEATRTAAQGLKRESPQAAQLVSGLADRFDSLAGTLRDRSIDDLVSAASDYTRRKPALVFGVAALAGFAIMRTFKNASASQSRARGQHSTRDRDGQFNAY